MSERTVQSVGIRELKTNLSRYMKRVRSGARLLVTERGRSIATINPIDAPGDTMWANAMAESGVARWNGGKPAGCRQPINLARRTASDIVLEERR